MSKNMIEWGSDKEKYEAIGFLARPGVVDRISAQVQTKYINKFKARFAGKYSPEYPYDVGDNKRGYQYRIDINHTEGCPSGLLKYITGKYALRLENNDFIRDLVDNYGFMFTNGAQNSNYIYNIIGAMGGNKFKWFKNTYCINERYINALKEKAITLDMSAQIADDEGDSHRVKKSTKKKAKGGVNGTFSDDELTNLGWIGELCVYKMLIDRREELLQKFELERTSDFTIDWYNNGFQNDDEWDDKSVGKGCDIEIVSGKRKIYVEVKTSRRKSNIFTMTRNEIVKMQSAGKDYYIVKIDNLDKILKEEPIDIQVFDLPYERFLKPNMIKTATFMIRGSENE